MNIEQDLNNLIDEFFEQINLAETKSVVLGCSSSEINGERIGKATNQEIGEIVIKVMMQRMNEKDIYLVVQGCEHTNRALVVEREFALKHNLELVNIRPVLSAGGACATAAYEMFKDPVMVEEVKVDAGIDIGQTLIGMHLKPVAIPLRLKQKTVGAASANTAKTRLRMIGGSRAHYQTGV